MRFDKWCPELETALKATFPEAEVKFKPKAPNKDTGKALALAHIDARAVANRLDACVGPENWSDSYAPIPGTQAAIICRLTVLGVTKEGIGESEHGKGEEEWKSAESDAFKRAANKGFGVGRYLHGFPRQYLAFDGKKFTEKPRMPATPKPTGSNKPQPGSDLLAAARADYKEAVAMLKELGHVPAGSQKAMAEDTVHILNQRTAEIMLVVRGLNGADVAAEYNREKAAAGK